MYNKNINKYQRKIFEKSKNEYYIFDLNIVTIIFDFLIIFFKKKIIANNM